MQVVTLSPVQAPVSTHPTLLLFGPYVLDLSHEGHDDDERGGGGGGVAILPVSLVMSGDSLGAGSGGVVCSGGVLLAEEVYIIYKITNCTNLKFYT